MGDRANIGFRSRSSTGECVFLYTHWSGSRLPELAASAVEAARPRWGDASYATRMALTALIGDVSGDTGWGVGTGLDDNEHDILIVDWNEKIVSVLPSLAGRTWHEQDDAMRADSIRRAPFVTFDRIGDLRKLWH
jgi:hypothetical protein